LFGNLNFDLHIKACLVWSSRPYTSVGIGQIHLSFTYIAL